MAGAGVVLVVDVANVMGSRPDGWWRDRAGSAQRLISELAPLAGTTVPGPDEVPLQVLRVMAVVEGAAREVPGQDGVDVVRSAADGDSAVLATASELLRAGDRPLVVTADRGLRRSLPDGVDTAGPRWLLNLL